MMIVTPSSKIVGDLAQFMVQNNLNEESLLSQAGEQAILSCNDRLEQLAISISIFTFVFFIFSFDLLSYHFLNHTSRE